MQIKKTISFLFLSIVLCNNVLAQSTTLPYPSQNPSSFGSKLIRIFNAPITKEGLINGAKIASGFVVANKFKFIVGGTVLSGVAGYNYLIDNPEKMGEFFASHPNLLDEFTRYVDYRIGNAKTQEELDTFNNVKHKLALDQNINNAQSIAIENDPIYQTIEQDVREEVDKTVLAIDQSGNMPQCNINVVAQLLGDKKIFNNGVNNILPQIISSPTKILNVSSYKELKSNYDYNMVPDKLTPDHIPSYGALAKYFESHQFNLPPRLNSNLEGNSSSIMIPTELHENTSRTYGGRNKKQNNKKESLMLQDAQNLLDATILDIAVTAYFFTINTKYHIKAEDYIKSSMIIVERNKLLCMYDVPYNYANGVKP